MKNVQLGAVVLAMCTNTDKKVWALLVVCSKLSRISRNMKAVW